MEFVCAQDPRPAIPDAVYEAQCIGFETGNAFGKGKKLFLKFVITSGEYQGTELFMPFNMPFDGKIKPGMKFYKCWLLVNGDRPPSRNAKMSPKKFLIAGQW
jgi:hypothetical protein